MHRMQQRAWGRVAARATLAGVGIAAGVLLGVPSVNGQTDAPPEAPPGAPAAAAPLPSPTQLKEPRSSARTVQLQPSSPTTASPTRAVARYVGVPAPGLRVWLDA